MGVSDVTLFAEWSENAPAYHVLYFINIVFGSGERPGDSSDYQPGDTAVVLDASGYTKADYAFVDWNTKLDGSGDSCEPGDLITMAAVDVRLYGVWMESPPYHVSYNDNGKTGGWPPLDSTPYQQGDTVTVLGQSSLLKIGFAFAGWNTEADGSGGSYGQGDTFPMARSSSAGACRASPYQQA
jgi:hypothetical protein